MAMSLSSPVTGGAQTGFTSPTYTLSVDTAPDVNAKQWAVTALGGTQATVTTNTPGSPFTITTARPKVLRAPAQNVSLGAAATGRNVYKVLVRKGVTPYAAQVPQTMLINCEISVPVGADTTDPGNVRAAISAMIGSLNQISAGIGDTVTSGVL
jgi:hypothetical protein